MAGARFLPELATAGVGAVSARQCPARRRRVLALCALAVLVAAGATGSSAPELDGEVRAILTALESYRYTIPEAIHQLKALPRGGVVEALIWQIRRDERREMAYFMLSSCGATEIPAGLDQFLAGLADVNAVIRNTSARALAGAPAGRQDEVSRALGDVLAEEAESGVRLGILHTLARMGTPAASRHLAAMQADFRDANLPKGHRAQAAEALLRVGGVAFATEEFARADPAGEWAGLEAITTFSASTQSSWATDAEDRESIASFVLRMTGNPDVETRRASMSAMVFLLGPKAMQGSQDQLALNRRVRAALAARVGTESDAELAETMRRYLDVIEEDGRLNLERARDSRSPN